MAINFPENQANGATFTDSTSGVTYTYNSANDSWTGQNANSSVFVDLTSTQTVGGTKTFTSDVNGKQFIGTGTGQYSYNKLPGGPTTDQTSIVSPAGGFIRFDSTTKRVVYYDGTAWITLTTGEIPAAFDLEDGSDINNLIVWESAGEVKTFGSISGQDNFTSNQNVTYTDYPTSGGSGSNCTVTFDSAFGVVSNVKVAFPGANYLVGNTLTVLRPPELGGGAVGFTVQVASVNSVTAGQEGWYANVGSKYYVSTLENSTVTSITSFEQGFNSGRPNPLWPNPAGQVNITSPGLKQQNGINMVAKSVNNITCFGAQGNQDAYDNSLVISCKNTTGLNSEAAFATAPVRSQVQLGQNIFIGNFGQSGVLKASIVMNTGTDLKLTGKVEMPTVTNTSTGGSANLNISSGGEIAKSTSSARYKNNIRAATALSSGTDLALVNSMVPKMWEDHTSTTTYKGFIAEELFALSPDLVTYTPWNVSQTTFTTTGGADPVESTTTVTPHVGNGTTPVTKDGAALGSTSEVVDAIDWRAVSLALVGAVKELTTRVAALEG